MLCFAFAGGAVRGCLPPLAGIVGRGDVVVGNTERKWGDGESRSSDFPRLELHAAHVMHDVPNGRLENRTSRGERHAHVLYPQLRLPQ